MGKFELVLAGFNANTDDTDHLILWVAVPMQKSAFCTWLDEIGLMESDGGLVAQVCDLPYDAPPDFVLPEQVDAFCKQVRELARAAEK